MTSLQTSLKQSKGYFVTTAANCIGYTLSGASGAGGSFVPGTMTALSGNQATTLALTNIVLRDMGKTVVNPVVATQTQTGRVFRKVQILNRTGVLAASIVSNGITGGDNTVVPPYYTCYIELPSPGSGGLTVAPSLYPAPVQYIPGMPVF